VGVSQTLRRCTEGATYIQQGYYHVGHWPTFLVLLGLIAALARCGPLLQTGVCHDREPYGSTDRDVVWVVNSGGPYKNHVLDGDPDRLMGKGNFEGEGAAHCKETTIRVRRRWDLFTGGIARSAKRRYMLLRGDFEVFAPQGRHVAPTG